MFCEGLGNTSPTGECNEGYFCTGFANSSTPVNDPNHPMFPGGICPESKYCPKGSKEPLECPAGSYCGDKGLGKLFCFDRLKTSFMPNFDYLLLVLSI